MERKSVHLKRGVSMELHLDASIDKLDNLDINVQLDKEKYMEKEQRQSRRWQKLSEWKQEAAHKEVSKVRGDKAR